MIRQFVARRLLCSYPQIGRFPGYEPPYLYFTDRKTIGLCGKVAVNTGYG